MPQVSRKKKKGAPSDAQRLIARRKALGLSQQAVADRVGVTLRTYQRWEASDELTAMRQMLRLAAALETSPTELLDATSELPRSSHEVQVEERLDQIQGLLSILLRDRETLRREADELIRQELDEPASRGKGRRRR